ncbi:hypothetical protein Tco_0670476 [Tanacetum coccineum]
MVVTISIQADMVNFLSLAFISLVICPWRDVRVIMIPTVEVIIIVHPLFSPSSSRSVSWGLGRRTALLILALPPQRKPLYELFSKVRPIVYATIRQPIEPTSSQTIQSLLKHHAPYRHLPFSLIGCPYETSNMVIRIGRSIVNFQVGRHPVLWSSELDDSPGERRL